ncbi:hypothetical protein D9M68_734900 [compost metagenome]
MPLVTPPAATAVVVVPSFTVRPVVLSTLCPTVTLLLTFTSSASLKSRFVPVRVIAMLLSELLKSTLPPGATLPPVASPLAATFQPALAVSLTFFSCSSVAARPTVAKLGSVNVVLLRP